MFTYSASLEANPQGITPILTHEQVWRGLVMKAENAVPFVPGMQSCVVLERYQDGFLREIVLRGQRMRERILFTAPIKVRFERIEQAGGKQGGWIENLISESEHGLLLTFTFAVTFPNTAPDSEEERRQAEGMKANYLGAVEATLRTVRRLVSEEAL